MQYHFTLLLTFLVFNLYSQSYYTDITTSDIPIPKEQWKRTIAPDKYRLVAADVKQLRAILLKSPRTAVTENVPVYHHIILPMPDGTNLPFFISETSVMDPSLQAKFPQIRTYRVRSINGQWRGRIGIGPESWYGTITNRDKEEVYIDPFIENNHRFYQVYYTRDHLPDEMRKMTYSCGAAVLEENQENWDQSYPSEMDKIEFRSNHVECDTVLLRTYRIAVTTTAEYSNRHGGTEASVLAEVSKAINRINSIWKTEIAVCLMLVDGTENAFYYDSQTDPFTNGVTSELINQASQGLDPVLNRNAYDIGHVFCTNAGGLAQLNSVCGFNSKMRGVSCETGANDRFYVQILAHELGHQMGASHIFNKCDMENESSGNAFEPGSGSTIMSYAGLCGSNNITNRSDPYYNVWSIQQMLNFKFNGGSNCGDAELIDNTDPDVAIPYDDGFYIPVLTPFELTADGFDCDGNELYYNWEQADLGPLSNICEPGPGSPLFRSFPPTTDSTRVFPQLKKIIDNNSDCKENLPEITRELNFKVSVRDMYEGGGGFSFAEVEFNSTASAGPFEVLGPDTDTTFHFGTFMPIIWDVANTDNNLVDCDAVDIILSTDGGMTFTDTLLRGTPNDGFAEVLVPEAFTTSARIKVKAADNVFFNINTTDFNILTPTDTTFAVYTDLSPRSFCLPDNDTFVLRTRGYNFSDSITLEVFTQMPGVTINLSDNRVAPGDSIIMDIEISEEQVSVEGELTVIATAGGDTLLLTYPINIISTDFTDLTPVAPDNGSSGFSQAPVFYWEEAQAADEYIFELSTSPLFGELNEVVKTGLDTNFTMVNLLLEDNTIYYWRVFGVNDCGISEPSPTFAFKSQVVDCSEFEAMDELFISPGGTPAVSSTINIPTAGTVSEVQINRIYGNHGFVGDLSATLTSPQGTKINLWSRKCSNSLDFDLGFDDDSNQPVNCPIDDERIYIPEEPLSTFEGEQIQGDWLLTIKDHVPSSGGEFTGWSIEFCSSVSLSPPFNVNNDTLMVSIGMSENITQELLLSEDPDNEANELQYTLVENPSYGSIYVNGFSIIPGQNFTQMEINEGVVEYVHSGAKIPYDFFSFVVQDPDGGWYGISRFNVRVDTMVSVKNHYAQIEGLEIYPNPVSDVIKISLEDESNELSGADIWSVKGARIFSTQLRDKVATIHLAGLNPGTYILRIITVKGVAVKKIIKL